MTAYSTSIACILCDDGDSGTVPVGTGILLDKHRVLTCAHVVNKALGREIFEAEPPIRKISLTLPWCQGGSTPFEAYVVKDLWFPPSQAPEFGKPEDLAVLALTGDAVFPEDTASALLIDLDLRDEHDRRVWLTGFPGTPSSDRISGLIHGLTSEGRIQIDPVLRDRVVAGGFSGAGIWDERCGGIIGMLIAKRKRGEATIAYGLPVNVIAKALGLETTKPDEVTLRRLPEFPRNFIPREAFLCPLRERVLAGKGVGVTAARATALKGMGGLGKTALATALVYDPDVAARFGRERYWISMGQKQSPVLAQAELFRDVTGQKADFDDWQAGRKRLKEVLSGRSCLIVIDDIWTAEQAGAFEGLGQEAVLLVTTRQGAVLQRLGAEPLPLDVLNREQSRELLAGWAGITVGELPECTDAVIDECGRLPLALATFGAAIAMSELTWLQGLEALQGHDLGDLARPIQGYEGNEGVFGAIALSFGALAADDQNAFVRCAVFPEDRPIPQSALLALWHDLPLLKHGDAMRELRRLCKRLEDASLWRLENVDDGQPTYRIHDLISDFLQARLKDPIGTHSALVEAYRAKCPDGWASGPTDGYFFQFLPTHLAAAGRFGQLKEPLSDYRWMAAKLSVTTLADLMADYDYLAGDEDAELVQGALQLSAHILTKDPGQLPCQLTGRLRGNERPALSALVADIERLAPRPWLCPQTLSLIPPGGPLVCTFTGHQNSISALSVLSSKMMGASSFKTKDWIGSISRDNTFKLWDKDSSSLVSSLGDTENPAICFSPRGDGIHILIGFQNGNIIMFDIRNNRTCYCIPAHQTAVVAINTLYSQESFFTISCDGNLATWEADSGRNLQRITLLEKDNAIRAIADSTGKQILLIHQPYLSRLSIVDLDSGSVSPFRISHHQTHSITVTPDFRYVVSCGASGRFGSYQPPLRVWDLRSGSLYCDLKGGGGNITLVISTSDNKKVISCHSPYMSQDDTHLCLWDIESGRLLGVFQGHSKPVLEIQTAADVAVTCAPEDNRILLWDLNALPSGLQRHIESTKVAPKAILGGLAGHCEEVVSLAIAETGCFVVSGDKVGVIKCWDVTKVRSPDEHKYHTAPVCHVSAGNQNTSVVSYSSDGVINNWDFGKDDYWMTSKFPGSSYVPSCMRDPNTPDSALYMVWAVTGSRSTLLCIDGSVWQLEWERATNPASSDGRHGNVKFVRIFNINDFSAAQLVDVGQYLIVAKREGDLNTWDVQNRSIYKTYKGHSGKGDRDSIACIAVSDDMSLVSSVSWNGSLTMWDFKEGSCLAVFERQLKNPLGVFFVRKDAVILLFESGWGVLESKNGNWEMRYHAEKSKLIAGAISRDRRQLCCAQQGEMVRAWDIETNRIVGELRTDAPLTCICSAAGNRFVVGSKNGAVHVVSVAAGP